MERVWNKILSFPIRYLLPKRDTSVEINPCAPSESQPSACWSAPEAVSWGPPLGNFSHVCLGKFTSPRLTHFTVKRGKWEYQLPRVFVLNESVQLAHSERSLTHSLSAGGFYHQGSAPSSRDQGKIRTTKIRHKLVTKHFSDKAED